MHLFVLSPTAGQLSQYELGPPTEICPHCLATLWEEEKVRSSTRNERQFFLCCQNGKVALPSPRDAPPELIWLLHPLNKELASKRLRDEIRKFNSTFAMTSHGAQIDTKVLKGKGPYTFRIHGQNYHLIGSLLPEENTKPKYAQLYIYDTSNELSNRYGFFSTYKKDSAKYEEVDMLIIQKLTKI